MSSKRNSVSLTNSVPIEIPKTICFLCFNSNPLAVTFKISGPGALGICKLLGANCGSSSGGLPLTAETLARGVYCAPCQALVANVETMQRNLAQLQSALHSTKIVVQKLISEGFEKNWNRSTQNGPLRQRSTNNSVAAALNSFSSGNENDDDATASASDSDYEAPIPRSSRNSNSSSKGGTGVNGNGYGASKLNSPSEYLICPLCPQSTELLHRNTLYKHAKAEHPGRQLPSSLNYSCPTDSPGSPCKETFYWRANLKRHLVNRHADLEIEFSQLDLSRLVKGKPPSNSGTTKAVQTVKKQRFRITIPGTSPPIPGDGLRCISPTQGSGSAPGRIFACAVCPKMFRDPESLKAHTQKGDHERFRQRKQQPADDSDSDFKTPLAPKPISNRQTPKSGSPGSKKVRKRIRSSGGPGKKRTKYNCPDPSCSVYFYNRGYLREHMESTGHRAGVEATNTDDAEDPESPPASPEPVIENQVGKNEQKSGNTNSGGVARKSTGSPPKMIVYGGFVNSRLMGRLLRGESVEVPDELEELSATSEQQDSSSEEIQIQESHSEKPLTFDPSTNPYVCPMAPKCHSSFDELLSLKFHISVNHSGYKLDLGQVPRKCGHCDSVVKSLDEYRGHLETEHNEVENESTE